MLYTVEPAPAKNKRERKKSRKEIEEECRNIPTVQFPSEVGCDALEEEGFTEFVESDEECPGVNTITGAGQILESDVSEIQSEASSIVTRCGHCLSERSWLTSYIIETVAVTFHRCMKKVFKRTEVEVASEKAFSVLYGLCQPGIHNFREGIYHFPEIVMKMHVDVFASFGWNLSILKVNSVDKYALLTPGHPIAVDCAIGPNSVPSGLNYLSYFVVVPKLFITKERVCAYLNSEVCAQYLQPLPYTKELLKADFRMVRRYGFQQGFKRLFGSGKLVEFIVKRLPEESSRVNATQQYNTKQYNRALNRLLGFWVAINHPLFSTIRTVNRESNIGIMINLDQLRQKQMTNKQGRVFFSFTSGERIHLGDEMFSESV